LDYNTAAGWVKVPMKLSNAIHFGFVDRAQQADSTVCAQSPMRGGHSNLPLDCILPPPAQDMIDDIGEESDEDVDTWLPNYTSFLTTKTGLQQFEQKRRKSIISQHRHLEVI
jgi:hypothetical protein